MQGGPGETQPEGVDPGVSHLLASPLGEVIPGEKILLLKEAVPVMLSVMSDIRTINGDVHGTLGFHDPAASEVKGVACVVRVITVTVLKSIAVARKVAIHHRAALLDGKCPCRFTGSHLT